jgi:general stress protein 26
MKEIPANIVSFLHKQGFVIVSSLDQKQTIHCSAKGVVGIEAKGKVFLIDLYKGKTFENLKNNSTVSITAVNEHEFRGYCLKGYAKIVEREAIKEQIIKDWEEKVISRISKRVVKDVQKDKSSLAHPEVSFPSPKYLIEIDAEEIVDLTPKGLKP